jgi:hypothetical protein
MMFIGLLLIVGPAVLTILRTRRLKRRTTTA